MQSKDFWNKLDKNHVSFSKSHVADVLREVNSLIVEVSQKHVALPTVQQVTELMTQSPHCVCCSLFVVASSIAAAAVGACMYVPASLTSRVFRFVVCAFIEFYLSDCNAEVCHVRVVSDYGDTARLVDQLDD